MDVAKDHLVADFIQHAAKAADLHELGELFFKTLSKLGFTEWGYQAISQNTEKPVVLSTFPREWVAYYLENNLCKVDPLITKVPKTFTPFQWSELLKTETLTPQQKKYWAEADDYGLRDGIGIPIHGHKGQLSIVTLVSRKMHPDELSRIFHEGDVRLTLTFL